MDHQAFAQLLGNYGEFIGAIAVFGTLIYLATQVRLSREATVENTKAVRSQIYESLNQTEIAFSDFYAEHAAEIAKLQQLTDRDQLTPEQAILAGAFGSRTYRAIETVYLHHKNGTLDDELFEARIRGFRAFVDVFPGLRTGIELHRSSGAGGYSEDFIQFLEDAVPSFQSDETQGI